MSKTLQNIIEKAVFKGFANKNARMWLGYGYGQSKSDRDALVQLFQYCGRNDFHVSYRPSKDEFYVKAQFVGKKTLEDYII